MCIRDSSCAIDGLVALGHRHIGLIGGDRAVSDTGRLRFAGCMEAFARHQIPFDPERSYRGVRFSYAGGYRAARELLALNPDAPVGPVSYTHLSEYQLSNG